MFVPLSFGEDGASFEVPDTLDGAGWLVLRKSAEGRGRPAVVHHRNGKPLVIPLGSTHDDLLSAAGKGRYRLQIVDQYGRKVDGVPVAHTGMLGVTAYPVGDADEYDAGDDGEDGLQLGGSPVAAPRRSSSNETVLLHTVCSMFGQVVGQMVPMMNACTEIVETVSRVGLLGRAAVVEDAPPPVAPAPPPMGEASVLQTVMATLGPMVNQLCMALMMKGATPAAPTPAAVVPVQAPAVATTHRPSPMPTSPMVAPAAPMPPAPSSTRHPAASVPPSSAGAAPSDAHGAAPAEIPLEMQMRIGAQLRQVLAELTPAEQQLAAQLVTELPTEARTALLLELVHLSIPEAVARARSILASGSSSPSTGTPSTGTPRT